jgi:DNA-binding SARP family transcriptional activator
VTLRLRAFGAPALTLAGQPAPAELTWRKHFALLVYLARSPAGTRRRDHLVGLLWPDKDEARARHSLNEACRAIRRALGDTALETRGDTVALRLDALEADWSEANCALEEDDPERILAVWQGGFLEGFGIPDATPFEDWLAAERLGWLRRFRDALTGAAQRLSAGGRHREAQALADRVLRAEPTAESALHVAMTAEALAGAAPAALARYAGYAARLHEEQGAAPSAELARLADRIRSGQRVRVDAAPPRDAALPPLAGRAAALAALTPHLPHSGRAHPAVVLVSGGPGCGKSRLLRELVERARLDGARVVGTTCVAADGDAPWSTLGALLARGLAGAPGLAAAPPQALELLAAVEPSLTQRYAGVAPREAAGTAALGRALGEALAAVADEEPLVLAIDDAHFADEQTLEALPAALRAAEHASVLLLLAARLEEQPPAPLSTLRSRIGHDLPGAEVRAEPLEDSALEQLAAALLPAYGPEDRARLVRRLRRETGGVPLFAVEIMRALAGARPDAAALWPLAGQTTGQPLPFPIPGAAVAALTLRVQALGEPARTTLLAAAITGARVDEALTAALAPLPGGHEAAFAELERSGFLRDDGGVYHFTAELVRSFLEAEMAGSERRRLHRAAAEALAQRGTTSRDLAYAEHRYAAGEWAAAAESAAMVERHAGSRGAVRMAERAARLLRRAQERMRERDER